MLDISSKISSRHN